MTSPNKATFLTISRYFFHGTTLYVPSNTLSAGSMASLSQRAPQMFEMPSFAKSTPSSVRANLSLFAQFADSVTHCSLPDCMRASR